MTYVEELETAVVKLHGAEATFSKVVPVQEVFQGKPIWTGNVVVFDLKNHPKAKRAYAWGFEREPDDKSKGLEITTVLEIPPVKSAETAVKIAIASRIKTKQ